MNEYKQSKLSNGITVITGENKNSQLVNVSFLIRAGSRYEKSGERGYAHFLEHMLLQGTESKPSFFEISRIADRSGAWFNAFTDAEVVRLSASVAKNCVETILELMTDMIMDPLLDSRALENEKGVIKQELQRALDNRENRLWIESVKMVFSGHPLSNYPLGEEADIAVATPKKLRSYYERFFVPERMAVMAVGEISHKELCEFIENKFNGWRNENRQVDSDIVIPVVSGKENKFVRMAGAQTHVAFNFPIPALDFEKTVALDLVANYLGYRQTSLLYRTIRQKEGLVYGISVFDMLFHDAALFYISTYTTDPEKVIALLSDKIFKMEEEFDESVFKEYQKQVININNRRIGNPSEELQFLSKGWVLNNQLVTPQKFQEAVDNLQYQKVIETKRQYLNDDNTSIVALGEKDLFNR